MSSRRRLAFRIVRGFLIALGVLALAIAVFALAVHLQRRAGRAVIARQAPGYWWATTQAWPLLRGERAAVGMPIDPELHRRWQALGPEVNKVFAPQLLAPQGPEFKSSLAVVPLRVVNFGDKPFRPGFRLQMGLGDANGSRSGFAGEHLARLDEDLVRRISDPEARRRLSARHRAVPPHSTTDMLAVCLLSDTKSLDPGRIQWVGLSGAWGGLGFEAKPNFSVESHSKRPRAGHGR